MQRLQTQNDPSPHESLQHADARSHADKSPARRRKTTLSPQVTCRRRRTARRRTVRRRPARRRTARRRTVKRRGTARRRSRAGLFGMKRASPPLKASRTSSSNTLLDAHLQLPHLDWSPLCPCMSFKDQPRFNASESSSPGTVMGNAYGRAAIGGLLTVTSKLRTNSRPLGPNSSQIMANSIARHNGNAMRQLTPSRYDCTAALPQQLQ